MVAAPGVASPTAARVLTARLTHMLLEELAKNETQGMLRSRLIDPLMARLYDHLWPYLLAACCMGAFMLLTLLAILATTVLSLRRLHMVLPAAL